MEYKVILNDKKYFVSVNEGIVKCKTMEFSSDTAKGEADKSITYSYVNELPDFEFAEDEKSDKICSPMQGKIIEINVQKGKKVKSGDILAILESMKMGISILAPEDGIVQKVNVEIDEFVTNGQELFEIKNKH